MIYKKHVLITLFVVIGFGGASATPQIPDKLIYKGDTLSVYLSLPDEFYKPDTMMIGQYESMLTVNLFGDKKTCWSTACGREYQATWEIIDNQLYLTGIYSCCYDKDSIKADLASIFKEKVKNGKVKADWVSSKSIVQDRKESFILDHALRVSKREFEFEFFEGVLLNVKAFDNTKSRLSIYSQNDTELKNFIYTNIDWDNLPKQQESIIVVLRFSANEAGKIDEVEIVCESDNEIFNQESIRVIKSIPDWDVIYLKGEHWRRHFRISIVFSEENRVKYEK